MRDYGEWEYQRSREREIETTGSYTLIYADGCEARGLTKTEAEDHASVNPGSQIQRERR